VSKGEKANSRWLEGATDPGRQALRQALDETQPALDPALARHRVWHRVQSPWGAAGPRSSRGALLLGTGALVGVAVAVLVFVLRPHPAIVVRPPQVAALPAHGTVAVTTGPEQRERHRLPRDVDAALSPRTALVPGDEQAPPEVRVGRVRFSVPHQRPGQRYVVRAGPYQVAVLGTVFEVAVEEGGVSVAVESGVVAVEEAASGRRLERLTAGQRWSSAPPARSSEAARSSEPAPASEPVPTSEPARPDEAAREPGLPAELPPRSHEPVRSTEPAPRSRATAVRAWATHPSRGTASRRVAVRTIEAADPVAAGALDEARQARRTDPSRALALYERLASARGPLAEVALYEMGVIENESLHDPRRALGTWERYRERYPRGLLRAEADFSIIEVLTELREETRALDEARTFLRRYGQSERRGEVALVAADLARAGSDCGLAVDLYETAARGRLSAAQADDAAFNRAACLAALRDPLAARAAREYLARFPEGHHRPEAGRLLGSSTVTPGGR
jgi:ferric-dicitrate binding protein FerR (iron transport regulator)